jgi:hypothetical protein
MQTRYFFPYVFGSLSSELLLYSIEGPSTAFSVKAFCPSTLLHSNCRLLEIWKGSFKTFYRKRLPSCLVQFKAQHETRNRVCDYQQIISSPLASGNNGGIHDSLST